MNEQYGILTSRAIQKRYFIAARNKKAVEVVPEYIFNGINIGTNWVKKGVSDNINPADDLFPTDSSVGNATKEKEEEEEKEECEKEKPPTRKKAKSHQGNGVAPSTKNPRTAWPIQIPFAQCPSAHATMKQQAGPIQEK